MQSLIGKMKYTPRTCVWEITRACNLRCAHCGTSAGAPRDDELTTGECIDLAQQLAALGCRLITLSGGEPTVRGDWVRIAQAAVEAGVTVNMVTNGQVRDPQRFVRQIREAGLSNIGLSIDGLEETHDRIRRPGAFARAVETVRVLAEAGIWVDVMLTANRLNLPEIPRVYGLAWSLGARGFRVQLGKPMGNQTCRDDITLSPHHLLKLLPLLGELATSPGPVVNVGDSVGYFSPQERLFRGRQSSHGHWTGCWAGMQAIGIQSDGGIKGCLSLQPREGEPDPFIEGNVKESSLAEIWFRPGAFAYNRELSAAELTGACARCDYARVCRGGARCVAHAFTGELGCDPMCWYAVASERTGARKRGWTQAAAAAAAAMLLGLSPAACTLMTESDYGVPPPDGDADADADSDADSDGDEDIGPQPDYGVIPPDGDADADSDGDEDIGPQPDYGVIPPDGDADADSDGDLDADLGPSCDDVECSCFACPDYGDPAPWECTPCAELEVFQACCCEDVICEDPCPDCDYGVDPPMTPERYWCCMEDEPGLDYGVPEPPPEDD